MSAIACPKCGYDQATAEQCPRCGLIIGRYRERPARPSAPRGIPAGSAASRKRSILAWVLGGGALVVLFIFAFLAFITSLIKNSEPYRLTETLVQGSDGIRAVVGHDPRLGYWVVGSVETSGGGGGTAELTVPVKGAEGSTRVFAVLRRQQGTWVVKRAVYLDRNGAAHSLIARSAVEAEPAPQ